MIKKQNLYINFILSVLLIAWSIVALGQDKPIGSYNVKLNSSNVNLSEILKQIEDQTNLKFNYDQSVVNINQKTTIKYTGNLKDALNIISRQLSLDFGLVGKTISIR